MRFIQNGKDGSCRVIFSEQEKKNNKRKRRVYVRCNGIKTF